VEEINSGYNNPWELFRPGSALLAIMPGEIALRHQVVPLESTENGLLLAAHRPLSSLALAEIKAVTSLSATAIILDEDVFKIFMTAYQQGIRFTPPVPVSAISRGLSPEESGRDIVRISEGILNAAWQRRASDIHLEPQKDGLLVRFRIDGLLREYTTLSNDQASALVARIKILAQMDVAQKFEPQDGHLEILIEDTLMQMRAATIPVLYGEKIVLRFLYREVIELSLEQLGMAEEDVNRLQALLSRPYGLLLVTGPTGSGKTTTLYSALNYLNSPTVNITSIEDPIEYELEGINQIAVNTTRGMTFAQGLRGILRQDPDIIMVGEIRDRETADVALRAAITGRLVLSSLHTNDACGAILRLLDMEIEPYIITAALIGVVGQRLVRQLCPRCKRKSNIEETPWDEINVSAPAGASWQVAEAKGCDFCQGTGYTGRSGVFEILEIDEDLQRLIMQRPDLGMIQRYIRGMGWHPMLLDGWRHVLRGRTDVAELKRVLYI